VATDELKVSIDALILELNDATLADILELNVEYPVVPVISTWILPDITDSVLILFLIVVSIELVKVFKLLVADSILPNLPFCVSLVELSEEDKLPILELSPDVVVATEELKEVIDELRPDVTPSTDELKEPILELKPDVIVLTLELNAPMLVEILELNVEYPVVPVIST
jgi:hypothetical protein